MAQRKPSAWQSILAGGSAGTLESLITYPTEFVKTRQQLSLRKGSRNTPSSVLLSTLKNEGVRPMFTGVGVFCLSNGLKPAVRFTTFELIRSKLPVGTASDKPSPLSNMLVGACAGVAESLTVSTPGEHLKTKLIDGNASKGTRVPLSTTQLMSKIFTDEGVRGFYRGAVPVTIKQSANSVVRFTSYQYLLEGKKSILGHHNISPSAITPAVAGGAAGVVTVYATMPFDNIKTKMQALRGVMAYRGSLHCVQDILKRDGLRALWKGTAPRLLRLTIAGTLAFSIYEQVIALTTPSETEVRTSGMTAPAA